MPFFHINTLFFECKMADKETGIECKAESSSDHDVQVASLSIDPVKERKLLWKLDLCICPLVMSIFLVAYLDRSNLGYVQNTQF
jgi:hypothetical protein